MMKRRWGVTVGLAILALVVWRWRACSSDAGPEDRPSVGAEVTTATASAASTKRPDPRTLKRGSIAGTVRDETTKPIAAATVCADISADMLPTELTRDAICVTTDAAGAFLIPNLFAAKYSVDAGARTYWPSTFHPDGNKKKDFFPLAAGEAKTGVDFVLRSGGVEITGTVNDISGGPIAHAKVRALGGRWGQGASTPVTETDDKGAFSLWMAPGQAQVTATADGYASAQESGRAPGVFELLLTPESSLSGIVVDARTGTPVEGAKVNVSPAEWRFGEGGGTERTDAHGKFRVERLTPGRYTATARTEHGYGTTEGSTLVGLGQQVEGVVVKLFPAAKIAGKVMIAGDKPTVCIEGGALFRDDARDRQVWARADPDGTLTAEGVLPGTYKPEPWCDGYQTHDTYDPIIVTDKDVTGLEWIVEPGATIKGKVLTKRGEPIEDAFVNGRTVGGAARAKSDWSGGKSERDGSYEMKGLRSASYKLEVSSDKGVPPREGYAVEVTGSKTVEKDLILDDGGTLEGLVVDAKGTPVEGVTIDAMPFADSMMRSFGMDEIKSDAKGTFTIDSLRPGDYRVTARRGWSDRLKKPGTTDDAKQGEKTTIVAAQIATVRLVVEGQTGIIRGTVVAPDGTPVSDAFISTARESDAAGAQDSSMGATRGWGWGDSSKPVLTGVDGTFTITKLTPGKYTLRAYRKGGGEAIAEHVAVGTTAKLEIKDTGSIAGVVTRDGAPLDEITVAVEDLKTGFERSETYFRTDGRFTLKDLPAGHFHVTASAEGGTKKIELDLAHTEAKTGVTLKLEELVTLTGRIIEHGTKKPVAGMRMQAAIAQGGSVSFGWGDDDRDNISDDTGRFTIKRAPRGQLQITGMHKDFQDSDYTFVRTLRTVEGSGTIDIGDITVLKNRIKDGEPAGELGINFVQLPNDTPPDKTRLEISFIEPGGPAIKTNLKVGDVITSVDGIGVTGGDSIHAWTLLRAPPGTKIVLGLARGASVTVVLAAPS